MCPLSTFARRGCVDGVTSEIHPQELAGMSASSSQSTGQKPTKDLLSAVVRFAGDSGDGMQKAGLQFTDTSAIVGNDVATLPDFPAEIRAPAGTVAGVS